MWKPRAAAISLSCKTPERRQSWMSSSSLSIPVGDTGQTYDVQTQIFHCTHQKCTVPSGLQLVQTQVQKVISEVLQAWNCPMNLSLTCSLPLSLYIYIHMYMCVCVFYVAVSRWMMKSKVILRKLGAALIYILFKSYPLITHSLKKGLHSLRIQRN